MLPDQLKNFRRPISLLVHLLLIPVGYYAAFALRFDGPVPETYMTLFWITVPFVTTLRMACLGVFGLYAGWWRHVGMHDLAGIVKAVTASSAFILSVFLLTNQMDALPRSILVLDWATAIFVFGGLRFGVRFVREQMHARHSTHRKRAFVIGAGEAGERLVRQVIRNLATSEIEPIGLIDDDRSKHGLQLHGVPVVGCTRNLKALVREHDAELLVIAIPSASRDVMQALVERCIDSGVEFKIVPSLRELLDGSARVNQLRDVQIEDLLGREPVRLDLDDVERDLNGKVVVVTGGAGSIGSELARQIARYNPAKLILIEQAESPLYFVDLELRKAYPELQLVSIIADVTDEARIRGIFARHRPDVVYHAAAYKHVPLMEHNPAEAIRNNVFGTFYVAQAAAEHGARKFVLISTDKAVHPSSVMGATKRVAERIVLGWPSFRDSATDFRAVRFGNVLGSDGSVVPLFKRQLAAGGPLTITHRDVTRYFMTIPEAVQLVLQAGALPEAASRILMLEMGEPIRIVDLAENLIRLSGLQPYTEMPIVFTGLRPGEKLHEELLSGGEATIATAVEKIRIVEMDEADPQAVATGLDGLAAALEVGRRRDLLDGLRDLVPECVAPLRDEQPAWAAAS